MKILSKYIFSKHLYIVTIVFVLVFNLVGTWPDQDKVFIEDTRAYKAAVDKVESCQIVTLIGGPGSGKTATARHVSLKFRERGWDVVPIVEIDEIHTYCDPSRKQVFVIDNVTTIFALNSDFYRKIFLVEEVLPQILLSKVICTCRKQDFNLRSYVNVSIFKTIVDLEDTSHAFDEPERRKMLFSHCESRGIDKRFYEKIVLKNPIFMFPSL